MTAYEEMARVVQSTDKFNLVLNRGLRNGAKLGDRFLIFSLGDNVFDPVTGEDLGPVEHVKGQVEIVHLQNAISTARSVIFTDGDKKKRIIKRPGSALDALVGLGMFARGEEEVIEEGSQSLVAVNAAVGDYAKQI